MYDAERTPGTASGKSCAMATDHESKYEMDALMYIIAWELHIFVRYTVHSLVHGGEYTISAAQLKMSRDRTKILSKVVGCDLRYV